MSPSLTLVVSVSGADEEDETRTFPVTSHGFSQHFRLPPSSTAELLDLRFQEPQGHRALDCGVHIPASACVCAAGVLLASAVPASAQQVAFERTYQVGAAPTLDVSTIRGKIDVSVGDADRMVVRGTATVRLGLSLPANASELVKRVAADPPVQQEGATLHLRPPSGADEQRAMTVAYNVLVPRGTVVKSNSDSGATTVSGISGLVSVRTQSAAINIRDLGGDANVTTGSGAVEVDGMAGDLNVSTQSSRVRGPMAFGYHCAADSLS